MSFGELHRRAPALSPWPNLARRPNDASSPGSNSERPAIRHTTARSDCEAHTASERPRRTSVANGEGEHLTARSNRRTARSPVLWRRESRSDSAHQARSDRPTRRLTRRGSTEEPWHARQVFETTPRWAVATMVLHRTAAELACTRCVPEPRFSILMRTTRALQPVNTGLIAVPPVGLEPTLRPF